MTDNFLVVEGDLLTCSVKYIAHQCNCVSNKASGIAKDLFETFSYSDVYSNRKESSKPGTIQIMGNGVDQRFVINMFAQVYPGKPRYPNATLDGHVAREVYFATCLLKLAEIEGITEVAFPYKIGCGVAGGNWCSYESMLLYFAGMNPQIKVFLFKKE